MAAPAPLHTPESELRRRETEIAIAVCRTFFILLVLLSPEFARARAASGAVVVPAVVAAASYNLFLFFVHYRARPFPRGVIIFGDLVLVTLWIYLCGGTCEIFFGLYYAVVIVAAIWFGIRGALISAVAACGFYFWAVVLTHRGLGPPVSWAHVLQAAFLLGTAVLVSMMATILRRESEELALSRATIRQNLQRIRIAQRVDDLVRPRRLATLPGFDVAFRFRPSAMAAAAGDYYDVIRLGNRRLGVCVGDICARLELAIPYLPVFKAEFRATARREARPARVLAEMNRWVMAEIEERQDRDAFISMCYVVLDLDEATLTYAIAGHEPPLLLSPGEEPRSLDQAGIVLGVVSEVEYQQEAVPLRTGDVLVLFSDGLTEVTNAEGRMLEREGLVEILRSAPQLADAEQMAERIFGGVNEFARGGHRRDDMTLVVVKVTATDLGTGQPGGLPGDFARPD